MTADQNVVHPYPPEKPIQSSPKKSLLPCVLTGVLGVVVVCIVPVCLLVFWQLSVPQSTVHDCLSLPEGGSVVLFSNTTDTAYRSNDDGMTWSRDRSIDEQTKPACSWTWPVTVSAEPPIAFYYMEGLGIYQSLDQGETLTLLPLALGKAAAPQAVTTPSDTLIISIGGGELWLRLPGGKWLQYKENILKRRLEPVAE